MSFGGGDRRRSTSLLIKETRLTDDDEADSEHGDQRRDNENENELAALIESDQPSITAVARSGTSQKASGKILQSESTSNNVVSVGRSKSVIESVAADEASRTVSEGRFPSNIIHRRSQLGENAPRAAQTPPSRQQTMRIHRLLAQRTAWLLKLRIYTAVIAVMFVIAVMALIIVGVTWLPNADGKTVYVYSVAAVVIVVLCILAGLGLWFVGWLMRLLDPLNDEEEEDMTVSQDDGEDDLASRLRNARL